VEQKSERTEITVVEKPIAQAGDGEGCLVMIYGGALGRRFPLTPPPANGAPTELVVGRSQNADIQLDVESVSRRHAAFVVHPGGKVLIKDFDSTNGTYVNEKPIEGQLALADGDFVKIGRSIFKYLRNNVEAKYHEEIYRLTTTDGLTGIYNKRYFLETLEREMGRCLRYDRPLSLVMIDIDFFKQVNDTHGHLAGDTVLSQLAALIAAKVRKEDIFARYGGEEFALILPEVPNDGAVQLAEKLRALVEATPMTFDGTPIRITISLGLASLPKNEITVADFVQSADDFLYQAKESGRNRVCYLKEA
jgi:diguanylate cyclase (GGDEF)-like protein